MSPLEWVSRETRYFLGQAGPGHLMSTLGLCVYSLSPGGVEAGGRGQRGSSFGKQQSVYASGCTLAAKSWKGPRGWVAARSGKAKVRDDNWLPGFL